MKKINIHNYEAFYLDYLEGNLNEADKSLLFSFLDENPYLKIELEDDLLGFKLVESYEVFENKEDLKEFNSKEQININNIDSWLIAQVENELNHFENNKLNEFISNHHLENNKRLIQSTILKPNLNEKLINKLFLKKKEGVIIPLYIKIASIAAVGFIIFILSQFNSINESSLYEIRENNNSFAIKNQNTIEESNEIIDSSNIDKIKPQTFQKLNGYQNLKSTKDLYVLEEKVEEEKLNDTILNNKIILEKDKIDNIEIVKNVDEQVENNPFDSINLIDEYTEVPKKLYTEPYKPLTNIASNLTKVDMSYVTSTSENEYQVMHVQIGNFEFERKKRK